MTSFLSVLPHQKLLVGEGLDTGLLLFCSIAKKSLKAKSGLQDKVDHEANSNKSSVNSITCLLVYSFTIHLICPFYTIFNCFVTG